MLLKQRKTHEESQKVQYKTNFVQQGNDPKEDYLAHEFISAHLAEIHVFYLTMFREKNSFTTTIRKSL